MLDGLTINNRDAMIQALTDADNLPNSYTKSEMDAMLAGEVVTGTCYTKAQSDANFVSGATLVSNYYTKTNCNNNFLSGNTYAFATLEITNSGTTNELVMKDVYSGARYHVYLSGGTMCATII